MRNFFDLRNINQKYKEFYEKVELEKSSSIFGAVEPLKVVISSGFKEKLVYITSDYLTASKCFEMFYNIYGDKATIIKPAPDNLIYAKAKSLETFKENSIKLSKIANNEIDVVVIPISALMSFYPSKESLKRSIIKIKTNATYKLETLKKDLISSGYSKQDLVSESGQFSLRGDVLDVYPINANTLYRVEFFDEEVESIFEIDGESMKKGKEVKNITLFPCKNIFLEDNEKIEICDYLEKSKNKKFDDNITKEEYIKVLNDLLFKLDQESSGYSLDYIMPLIKNKCSLFDYFDDFVCLVDECKMVYDEGLSIDKDLSNRVKELNNSGALLTKENNFIPFKEVVKIISNNKSVVFQKITNTNRFFEPKVILEIKSSPLSRYTHSIKDLAIDLKKNDFNGFRNILFARSKEDAKKTQQNLTNFDVEYKIGSKLSLSTANDCILEAEFASGFILPEEKICVIGTYDFLPRKTKENKLRAARGNVFSVPKIGDYVVHSFHGIGVCEGVQKLSGNFGTKDYVVVRYRDNDRLYVPIDQMDMLDKFSGAETPKRLSKIGGTEFAKVKDRVKASVKKLAFDLLELYAEREAKKGFVYSPDSELQLEFENSFPYTETEDQLISISEIKKDMEQGKVMDRLLCGDVGFGKTEVALRAAFKAVLDGKQVAIMAPTTILSEQHYNTAKNRMSRFGVNIRVLNRFKTPKQAEKILQELQLGKVDVICGTHRLLSKDVEFKDLGLIILDEEQKFGVEDKEKIKVNHPNVDVLTLSATPIPRTLHMSLSGIRDVSIISTPPSERLPISTYVTELTEELLKDAINKEINRGGQVYILFNSVSKIYTFADMVRNLVPEARIIVGHGQMSGKELEDVIYKFYHNEADVLICTTIIENGIDIENANTLIVCESDKFGLSQLYQLRGRVGRGNRMAYAYLTYEGDKVLTEDAYKRLDAISEFTEFGSGFKLAMRDLEIRGSGTILGAEQHGHMEKVGYELYSKLLSEAVSELQGTHKEVETEVLMKIAIDAFIPDSYMTKSEDRMVAYKTISSIKTKQDKAKITSEFEQVFGKVPQATENLMDIALLKAKAKELKANSVISSVNNLEIVFENKEQIIGNEKVGELIYKFRAKCRLDFSKEPKICFNREENKEKNFELLKEFLFEV